MFYTDPYRFILVYTHYSGLYWPMYTLWRSILVTHHSGLYFLYRFTHTIEVYNCSYMPYWFELVYNGSYTPNCFTLVVKVYNSLYWFMHAYMNVFLMKYHIANPEAT